MTGDTRGGQLDELNRATFAKHHRRMLDHGLSPHHPDSALPALLADLRINAEQVYADAAQTRKRSAAV